MPSDSAPLLYIRTIGRWSYRPARSKDKAIELGDDSFQDRLIKELAVAPPEGIPQPELLRRVYREKFKDESKVITKVDSRNFRALLHAVREKFRAERQAIDNTDTPPDHDFIKPMEEQNGVRRVCLNPDRLWIDHLELTRRLDSSDGTSTDFSALLLAEDKIEFDGIRDDDFVVETRDRLNELVREKRDDLWSRTGMAGTGDVFAAVLEELKLGGQVQSLRAPHMVVRGELVERATELLASGRLVSMYGEEKVGRRFLLRAVARDGLERFGWRPIIIDLTDKEDIGEINSQYKGWAPDGEPGRFNFLKNDLLIVRGWETENRQEGERRNRAWELLGKMLGLSEDGTIGAAPRIVLSATVPVRDTIQEPWIEELEDPVLVPPLTIEENVEIFIVEFRKRCGRNPRSKLIESLSPLLETRVSPQEIAELAHRAADLDLEVVTQSDLEKIRFADRTRLRKNETQRALLDYAAVFHAHAWFSEGDLQAVAGETDRLKFRASFKSILPWLRPNPGGDKSYSRLALPENSPESEEEKIERLKRLREARQKLAAYIVSQRGTFSDIELVEKRPETLDLLKGEDVGIDLQIKLARLAYRYWAYANLHEDGIEALEQLIGRIEGSENDYGDAPLRLRFNLLRLQLGRPGNNPDELERIRDALEKMYGSEDQPQPFASEARLERANDLYAQGTREDLNEAYELAGEVVDAPDPPRPEDLWDAKRHRAQAQTRMGWIELLRSEPSTALGHFGAATDIAHDILDHAESPAGTGQANLELARSLEGKGRTYSLMGRLEEAIETLHQALEVEVRPFDRPRLAHCRLGLAEIHRLRGFLQGTRDWSANADGSTPVSHGELERKRIQEVLHELGTALNQVNGALSETSSLRYRLAYGRLLHEKARILLTLNSLDIDLGDVESPELLLEAEDCFVEGRRAIGRTESWLGWFSEYLEGRIAEQKGRLTTAKVCFEKTLKMAETAELRWAQSRCHSALARIATADRQRIAVARHLSRAIELGTVREELTGAESPGQIETISPELQVKAIDAASGAGSVFGLDDDLRERLESAREDVEAYVLSELKPHPAMLAAETIAAVTYVADSLASPEEASTSERILGLARQLSEGDRGGALLIASLSASSGPESVLISGETDSVPRQVGVDKLRGRLVSQNEAGLLATGASAVILWAPDARGDEPRGEALFYEGFVALPLGELDSETREYLPEPMSGSDKVLAFAVCQVIPVRHG